MKNVSPTEFEQIHLDLPESSGIPNDKEVDSSELPEFHSSDDDFSTPPPKRSKNQPKTKSDPPVNNLEMSDEIQRLSDGQSELKSDIRKVWSVLCFSLTFKFIYTQTAVSFCFCFCFVFLGP